MIKRCIAGCIVACLAAGCGDSPKPPEVPVDSHLYLYNSTARLEFAEGELAEAAASYTKALDRAREMDDPAAITAAAYNLAIVKATLIKYPEAMQLLEEAEHESLRSGSNLADILLVEARINLSAKNASAAAGLADAVFTRPRSKPNDSQRLQAYTLKGLAACQLGDTAEASRQLEEAKKLSASVSGPAVGAMVASLSGQLHLLLKEPAAAAMDFDRQTELSRQARDYRVMDLAIANAGHAFAMSGNQSAAADRLYRAARAAVARNESDCLALARDAAAAASASGDQSMIHLTASLMENASATTRPVE